MVRPGLPDLYLYNNTIRVLGRKPKFVEKPKNLWQRRGLSPSGAAEASNFLAKVEGDSPLLCHRLDVTRRLRILQETPVFLNFRPTTVVQPKRILPSTPHRQAGAALAPPFRP